MSKEVGAGGRFDIFLDSGSGLAFLQKIFHLSNPLALYNSYVAICHTILSLSIHFKHRALSDTFILH